MIQTALRELDSIRRAQAVVAKRSFNLHDEVQRFEIDLIRSALQRTNGHQRRAARLLGVKVSTLHMKMKRHKISFIDED